AWKRLWLRVKRLRNAGRAASSTSPMTWPASTRATERKRGRPARNSWTGSSVTWGACEPLRGKAAALAPGSLLGSSLSGRGDRLADGVQPLLPLATVEAAGALVEIRIAQLVECLADPLHQVPRLRPVVLSSIQRPVALGRTLERVQLVGLS